MKFASNRLAMTGPRDFAESAARAEDLGWSMGLIPCSPLLATDPYVNLAAAAQSTTTLQIGTLLDTPVLRHPSVLASSIATVASLAPGRVHLGLGVGDTAVRLNGLAPATVDSLREATVTTRAFLAGEPIAVGAAKPARLRHAAPVPVWIAAQGPKTLHMAGAVADGVWIRVGRHPGNLEWAWQAVCDGAESAGRSPGDIQLGLIFHTAISEDAQEARTIGKAIAAGYYEYSRFLFDAPGIDWNGADVDTLKEQVWPDFHHHRDPVAAGNVVGFLPEAAADAFALHGDWEAIAEQLEQTLSVDLPVSYVIPHPVLNPAKRVDFLTECAKHLIPRFS